MTVVRAARRWSAQRPWMGCVVAADTGVFEVLTDLGTVRASLAGRLLALVAGDRRLLPEPGDWVVLRAWQDGPVTVESCCAIDDTSVPVTRLRSA